MLRLRPLLALLAVAGLLAGFLPGILQAQETAPLGSPSVSGPVQPVVVQIYFQNRDQLNAVAGELDIWEVHPEAGYAVAAVSPSQYRWLESLGYRVEVDREKTASSLKLAALDPRYYYYDDDYANANSLYLVTFLQDVNTAYSRTVELLDIGDAWQAGHSGHHRDLWVLRISNEDPAYGPISQKPPFYLMANIHAREVATPELAIRYIKYLTSGYNGLGGYGIDPDVTWLVDWTAVYIEVMHNPDGHRVNEENPAAYWRKNTNKDQCPSGSFGIDLNRNSSFKWGCCGGSSTNPCNEIYRGPSRGSEPETAAFESFFAATFQDQNGPNGNDEIPPAAPTTTTGIFLTLHAYSDDVLWPWGFGGTAPNGAQLRQIGRKLALLTGYTPLGFLYAVDGATDDWTYGRFGVASFTFEVGPGSGDCGGFFPLYDCLDGYTSRSFWAETRPAFLYMHKIARSPYLTVYGPDAGTLQVSPDEVEQGTPVTLTAHIQDHRYSGDPLVNIGGAEYFVDQPGTDGTGTPMDPEDGSWGGTSETAQATVDTCALTPGKHYVLVHGKSTANNWGPFTAVFLKVGSCEAAHDADFDFAPADPWVFSTVAFTASVTGTAPFDYAWSFGDGSSGQGMTPTHSYRLPGTYTTVLTVTNCCGSEDTPVHTVSVQGYGIFLPLVFKSY